jgi:hypothetical protein
MRKRTSVRKIQNLNKGSPSRKNKNTLSTSSRFIPIVMALVIAFALFIVLVQSPFSEETVTSYVSLVNNQPYPEGTDDFTIKVGFNIDGSVLESISLVNQGPRFQPRLLLHSLTPLSPPLSSEKITQLAFPDQFATLSFLGFSLSPMTDIIFGSSGFISFRDTAGAQHGFPYAQFLSLNTGGAIFTLDGKTFFYKVDTTAKTVTFREDNATGVIIDTLLYTDGSTLVDTPLTLTGSNFYPVTYVVQVDDLVYPGVRLFLKAQDFSVQYGKTISFLGTSYDGIGVPETEGIEYSYYLYDNVTSNADASGITRSDSDYAVAVFEVKENASLDSHRVYVYTYSQRLVDLSLDYSWPAAQVEFTSSSGASGILAANGNTKAYTDYGSKLDVGSGVSFTASIPENQRLVEFRLSTAPGSETIIRDTLNSVAREPGLDVILTQNELSTLAMNESLHLSIDTRFDEATSELIALIEPATFSYKETINVPVTSAVGTPVTFLGVPYTLADVQSDSVVLDEVTTLTSQLPSGFNLFSLPLQGTGITDALSLSESNTCSSQLVLYKWDPLTSNWTLFLQSPGGPPLGRNFSFSPGESIWIYCSNPSTIPMTGIPLPSSATLFLNQGFNFVALPVNAPQGMRISNISAQLNSAPGVECNPFYKWTGSGYSIHMANFPTLNNYLTNSFIAYCVFGGTASITST